MNLRDFGMGFNGSVKWIVSPKQWLKSVTHYEYIFGDFLVH